MVSCWRSKHLRYHLLVLVKYFNFDLSKTNVVDGQLTVIVRKKAIPLFYLEHWLVKGTDRSQRKCTRPRSNCANRYAAGRFRGGLIDRARRGRYKTARCITYKVRQGWQARQLLRTAV